MGSSNFFVDFTAFNFLGVIAGLEWMVAFSLATFLAMVTKHFHSRLMHRPVPARARRKNGDLRALPAFRRDADRRTHQGRRDR